MTVDVFTNTLPLFKWSLGLFSVKCSTRGMNLKPTIECPEKNVHLIALKCKTLGRKPPIVVSKHYEVSC